MDTGSHMAGSTTPPGTNKTKKTTPNRRIPSEEPTNFNNIPTKNHQLAPLLLSVPLLSAAPPPHHKTRAATPPTPKKRSHKMTVTALDETIHKTRTAKTPAGRHDQQKKKHKRTQNRPNPVQKTHTRPHTTADEKKVGKKLQKTKVKPSPKERTEN
ncbi:hypothetical protein M408DRAFT_8351 [Serendipita vermifera MAFF 305830]|uniref:Uncharacterized protein n=1 Tax=Serendipita vermifera MAFF 305830 TaxID=933852 RepID=A0A0C3AXS1_SERVB|nr:hypothetical protein M408DRAFT_8351 [Serendipita vermifera MAFF 305830]